MLNLIFQSVLTIVIPGIILAIIERKINKKGPNLLYYVSAATWFTNIAPQQAGGQAQNLHIITIAIRNSGTQVAKKIDISHFLLPLHFQVVPYLVSDTVPPNSTSPKVIKLNSLNPGEIVWISYVFNQIVNPDTFIEYVRSEEVRGTRSNMILNPVLSPNFLRFLWVLLILGIIFIGVLIWWLYPPLIQCIKWIISFPR